MSTMAFQPLQPRSVLCVAAHADDIEAFMGGTVAEYAKGGATVHYLILTDGSRGLTTDGPTSEQIQSARQEEQQVAASLLGVHEVAFSGYTDCELALTDGLKRDIVRAIRKAKPEVVMCIDPTMAYSLEWGMINHIDHRIAGEAVLSAVYPLACNKASYPELAQEGLEPHKVTTVLLANCDTQNFIVDISQSMDVKIQALKAHESQSGSLEEVFKLIQTTAEQMGARVGAKYAEAFIRLDLRI